MAAYDFTQITQQVAQQENIENCQLENNYSTNKGDGYLGNIQAVRLVGSNKTLDVVYKYSHRDPKAHDKLSLRLVYQNEINFYKTILPAFDAFQEKHHIKNPFNNVPKYYGSIEEPLNELLVLENLKTQNFDLWDRKQEMNRSHLECALENFAKFHGTSLAMKHLEPKKFAELSSDITGTEIFKEFIDSGKFYTQVGNMAKQIRDIFDPETEAAYREKMEYFGNNVETLIDDIFTAPSEYDVILQGDCWCNNAMYQYKDLNNRNVPQQVKMLDFQLVRIASVIFDLSYFFYTIASKECIDDLAYFQKLYHNSMNNHLKCFNLKIEEVFPFDAFVKEWKRCAQFGLMISFIVRKMVLVDSEDAPDFSEELDTFLGNIQLDDTRENLYKKQMKVILTHFIDNQFI